MNTLEKLLPSKIYETIDRVGIATPKEIITLSVWDIKKLTNLNIDDILLLKNIVADNVNLHNVTGNKLVQLDIKHAKLSSGSNAINDILNGGYCKGTITEIYGESGSGKTQLGLLTLLHNWSSGGVYICTEDIFPVKRYEQIKQALPDYSSGIDCGKNIFIEHIADTPELLSCVRVRLPKLIIKKNLSLIVIDTVAAAFRFEHTNYIKRAEELREFAINLIKIAQEYNLAVVCINQVTSSFDDSNNVIPSLGLAWSNMVSTRLWLRKTNELVQLHNNDILEQVHVRELSVVFAPDLPNSVAKFIITSKGIQNIIY